MAKQIIILGTNQSATTININAVFWFAISQSPLARTAGSAWAQASAAENSAIQAGTVLEEQQVFQFPVGTLAATMKDVLNKAWAQRNNALGGIGPAQFNGVFFDSGTGWSA